MLARVGVARLDGVGEREHGGLVGAPQLLGADALLLEHLAQVGGVALELALARRGLALQPVEPRAQGGDRVPRHLMLEASGDTAVAASYCALGGVTCADETTPSPGTFAWSLSETRFDRVAGDHLWPARR